MPDLISNGIALFFIWLFAVAALQKLGSLSYYTDLFATYLPGFSVSRLIVWSVAGSELFLVLLLLAPQSRAAGLLGSAGLVLMYALMMTWKIKRGGGDMACGCAGPDSALAVSPALVVRNLVCAALALLALLPSAIIAAGMLDFGLSLSFAIFLSLVYLCSDQMIANAQYIAGEV